MLFAINYKREDYNLLFYVPTYWLSCQLIFILAFFASGLFVVSMIQTHFNLKSVRIQFLSVDDAFEGERLTFLFQLFQKRFGFKRSLRIRSGSKNWPHYIEDVPHALPDRATGSGSQIGVGQSGVTHDSLLRAPSEIGSALHGDDEARRAWALEKAVRAFEPNEEPAPAFEHCAHM